MSSTIDTELAALHARIAQLEEAKKIPPTPKPTLEELIVRKKKEVDRQQNIYKFRNRDHTLISNYQSDIEMLESIVESLNRIHARLDALEKH
jgi:hypothetical protein